MKRLVANWPVDAERGDTLLSEYETVWNEIGEGRFRRAVDSLFAVSHYKFMPSVAEFRGYISVAAKKPLCGKCDSGWISVPDYEARRFYGDPNAMAVIRCECRSGPSYQAWRQSPEWRPAS